MRRLMMILCALGVLVISPGAAAAFEKAEVVYSSGGRIFSMYADGSNRHQLIGKPYDPTDAKTWNWLGDDSPAISPDGRYVAYSGWGRKLHKEVIRVADRDGKHPRVIFTQKIDNEFLSGPFWSPDNRIFIASSRWPQRTGIQLSRVISMKPDGSDRKIIYEKVDGKNDRWSLPVFGVDFSPDGKRMVFSFDTDLVAPGVAREQPFVVANLTTGKSHVLRPRGQNARWSPDGKRILFDSTFQQFDFHCWTGDQCAYDSKLYVIRPDGTGLRRITPTSRGADYGASWSPDGSRIIFISDRSDPENGYANEIYSVSPDGSCLTWLTNGSPEVYDVSWAPEADRDFSPGSCDPDQREPDLTRPLRPWFKADGSPSGVSSLWVGPTFNGRLIRDIDPGLIEYEDCSHFDVSLCGPELTLHQSRICAAYETENTFQYGDFDHLEPYRGGMLIFTRGTDWGGSPSRFLLAGQIELDIGLGQAADQILEQLRPVGFSDVSTPLPAAVFPRWRVLKGNRVDRTLSETGSIFKTATALEMSPKQVNSWKRFHDEIERVGPVKTVRCAS